MGVASVEPGLTHRSELGRVGVLSRRFGPLAALAMATALLAACGGAGGGGGGATAAQAATSPNAQRSGAASVKIHYCTPKGAANAADPCWKGATSTAMTNIMAGSMPSGFAASFQAVWDMKNLYVLETVKNPAGFTASNANTTNPWQSDAMEIYLSGDNGGDTSMGTNDTQIDIPLGAPSSVWVLPGHDASGVTATVKTASGGYDVMMAIPWSAVGATAGTGQVIGADPAADTYSDGSAQNQAIAWGTPGSSEQNPSIWGQLILEK